MNLTGQPISDSNVPLYKVDGLTLSVLSKEDVSMLSVTSIETEQIFKENSNGEPVSHGINDDFMGTMDKDRLCKTCLGSQTDCPGHFGNIRLERPVYHCNMLEYIRKVLRMVCCKCSHLLAIDLQANAHAPIHDEFAATQRLQNPKHRFKAVYNLAHNIKKCSHCGTINHKYVKDLKGQHPFKIDYEIHDDFIRRSMPTNDSKQVMWPEQTLQIFEKISPEHLKMMGLDKKNANPANLIIEDLAVAPPPVRPSVAMSNTMRAEDDLTIAYTKIIKTNNELRNEIKRGNNESQINITRDLLQYLVATVMDNEIQSAGIHKHKSGKPFKAISSRLKGKSGRLRNNLMGKRVDFSSRSVITPDPSLKLDQLGVPLEIAMRLTIPEIVTEQNMDYLRNLVDRGANNWPGAKYIKRLDGRFIDLSMLPNRTDQHLEVGYTVERHLANDDYVIFNRQPSLHKMSLMGHRVKVLPFQTFRLNLSVTSPYNADFDGDEMNMHVPQSMETKAEVKEIMAVPKQIVAPKNNSPCMGIVQDALLGVFRMTQRDTFIDLPFMMNLLMWVDYDLEKGLPAPAIIKPKPLWTGKQILSLVFPGTINIEQGKQNYADPKDDFLVIQKGELMQGIVHKDLVGAKMGGLIHIVWKDLGPQACCDVLSNIQYVVNNWLVQTGFTVGVADIIAHPSIVKAVRDKLQQTKRDVRKVINTTQNGKLKQQPGKKMIESFEANVNRILNDARSAASNLALKSLLNDNRLKEMQQAGSKGGPNNICQIMACVGQQNVEGQRIGFGFQKRSLPHFTKDDYGPESKGFVENSYVIGLTPSEFYFHAMGGREGLIDTAVKTADTGYVSRRLMKAMEDVMVQYDGTVRTSKEVIIQFLYGEDGMSSESFETIGINLINLDNKQLDKSCNFVQNIKDTEEYQEKLEKCMDRECVEEIVNNRYIQQMFLDEFEQLKQDRDALRYDILLKDSRTPMPVNLPRLINNIKQIKDIKHNSVSNLDAKTYFDQMKKLQDSLAVIPQVALGLKENDIISEAHKNSLMLFKIFLRYHLCSKKIITEDRLDKQSFEQLIRSIQETFRSAIVHPAEMCGSIAAQSMGEPATQMTLNTFHNAGIASMNVTLGVPRLKEVINVAKTIKTPSLKIFLDPSIYKDMKEAQRIGQMIEYTDLKSIVHDWGIYYDPDTNDSIIKEDQQLIETYNLIEEMQAQARIDNVDMQEDKIACRWLLRYKIENDIMKRPIFNQDFQFQSHVVDKINSVLNFGGAAAQVVCSEDTGQKNLVIRIRLYDVEEEESKDIIKNYRDMALFFLGMQLKGIQNISKVFYTSSANECNVVSYDKQTGEKKIDKNTWIIETDGVDLANVLSLENVDATKTTSNHVIEIIQVLGIEAARMALIKELRMILGTYGIYVNYRHLSTLVDIMTQRGIFTSITRHGINRVDSGPLRKSSFEETTEILLEAAFFGEHDPLSGISENVIFGQLASYGTGAIDLIVDKEALLNGIEQERGAENVQMISPQYQQDGHDYLTPLYEEDVEVNPEDRKKYDFATKYTEINNNFTPNLYNSGVNMTPASDMASQIYSPTQSGGYGNYQNSSYYGGQSPMANYNSTAYGGTVNNQKSSSYFAGSASIYKPYSPSALENQIQSPSHSPSSSSYGQYGLNPMQASTNMYQQAFNRPNLSSVSHQTPYQQQMGGIGAQMTSNYAGVGLTSSVYSSYSPSNTGQGGSQDPAYGSNHAPEGAVYNPPQNKDKAMNSDDSESD